MAQKITKNHLKRLINEVLNEEIDPLSLIPMDGKNKFTEACKAIGLQKGLPMPKSLFKDTISRLADEFYDKHMKNVKVQGFNS
jgi:hypothetical protein